MEEKQNSQTSQDFDILYPNKEKDVADIIKKFYKSSTPIELIGSGSKRKIGKPLQCGKTLSLSKLEGIIEYLPEYSLRDAVLCLTNCLITNIGSLRWNLTSTISRGEVCLCLTKYRIKFLLSDTDRVPFPYDTRAPSAIELSSPITSISLTKPYSCIFRSLILTMFYRPSKKCILLR